MSAVVSPNPAMGSARNSTAPGADLLLIEVSHRTRSPISLVTGMPCTSCPTARRSPVTIAYRQIFRIGPGGPAAQIALGVGDIADQGEGRSAFSRGDQAPQNQGGIPAETPHQAHAGEEEEAEHRRQHKGGTRQDDRAVGQENDHDERRRGDRAGHGEPHDLAHRRIAPRRPLGPQEGLHDPGDHRVEQGPLQHRMGEAGGQPPVERKLAPDLIGGDEGDEDEPKVDRDLGSSEKSQHVCPPGRPERSALSRLAPDFSPEKNEKSAPALAATLFRTLSG